MAYVETPRTDAGNSTYMPNGCDLEDFSAENTFLSPSKKEKDLVSQMRNGRGISLRTPRPRVPLGDRRNLQAPPAQGEFTPLLKSVAKKNFQRSGKYDGVPETPAFLKNGYRGGASPALPTATPGAYSENTGSSIGASDDGTPVPQIASSSAQVTPLATLPKREGEGVLTDQGNVLTLREQENVSLRLTSSKLPLTFQKIINKIEKENFGLKLKIHFLEDSLRKSGPGLNETALKENADLKVDRVTLRKELARARKTMDRAEREVEQYQKELQNAHDQTKRKHADKKVLEELEFLRRENDAKESQIREMCVDSNRGAKNDSEIEKLKSDIDDLQLDIREKVRQLDDREDEIDGLKQQVKQNADALADAVEQSDQGRQRIDELERAQREFTDQLEQFHGIDEELADAQTHVKSLENDIEQATTQAEKAQAEALGARQAQEKAEADLEELRDEMSNKSFSSKGLTRQLEEKIQKLQKTVTELREKESKSEQDANQDRSRLKGENGQLQQKLEIINQKCESLKNQLQHATSSLERKCEEKELLHSRHDALTAESKSLQDDLTRSQAHVKDLEASLEVERSHALENDRQLRDEAEEKIRQLCDKADRLQRELEEKASQHAAEQDQWHSQRRALESERERAIEQSAGLQRTINKLQETEGTLSGREHKLQEALESEKQRHQSQEASLKRDLDDLDANISGRRKQLAESQSELAHVNEELRVSRRNEADLEDKIQALEDEVSVLQENLDEEVARAKDESSSVRQEAEFLRRQLHSAKQELSRAEGTLADTRAELEAHQGDLQAGQGSQDQLSGRLRNVESELQRVRTEKQSLQDKLANNSLELRGLRSSLEDCEAERDQIKCQLKQLDTQVDKTFMRDQEKTDLKKTKIRLEADISRMKEERNFLVDKNEAVERELEEEVQNSSAEVGRLSNEIAELKRDANTASDSRDRELKSARQLIQRMESQVQELEERAAPTYGNDDADVELSVLHKDLAAARKRETESLQRESAQRETVRDLKHQVTRLERQVHEAELATIGMDSPKSSVGGSARKTEIAELRSQLSDAHRQLKDLRSKSRDSERELRRKLDEAEREGQLNMANSEQEREQLEQEISSLRHDQGSEQSKLLTAEKTISRLRTRIQTLESSLRDARNTTVGDRTMADERKDLHEMLKDAKIEAEDLQLQISTRETNLKAAATREEELRTHLQRVRGERAHQQKKSSALVTELDALQSRYERAVENLGRQQKAWEAERKAMNSRVRFPNTSISEDRGAAGDNINSNSEKEVEELQLVVREKEQRHASELNGMATQIGWLRWKLEREADFRNCLKFEKSYLTTTVKMYEACNKLDLALMKKYFGIDAAKLTPEPRRKPSLRKYAHAVVFTLRCGRFAREWKEQQKVKTALNRALEVARRGVLRKRIEAAGRD
ncbi:MAG: hypothetical protein LQ348_001924 [Seirophora lacunosa]|nr:MAG: hypothetical protein LQ348_001924 [Seirophora lacunosa]